ncbi:MAG: tetrahydrofolate dehydrogenase/cyclohydrolase catalytic domain-containing protein [Parcubacteria group bacterium]|jgi:methylenetetrahydrofolate dehydrogenase (NADP+)/methenyltetrahydrofolate cyclohydrolase
MILLDGAKLAERIRSKIKDSVSKMEKKPVLAIVTVGEDPASRIYVENKIKAAREVEIVAEEIVFPEEISENQLIEEIDILNADDRITAILVQLPLPDHIDRYNALSAIDPGKDADCLTPANFGEFMQSGEQNMLIGPATPLGIIELMSEYDIEISGKNAVIVGYSDIVGKPLSEMFLERGGTVTICHDKTHNLSDFTERADILVSATGVKGLITADMVKSKSVVIDVGISRNGTKIAGDVNFDSVSSKAAFITPVPGGVGPMTVAILLRNVINLASLSAEPERTTDIFVRSSEERDVARRELEKLLSEISLQTESIREIELRLARHRQMLETADRIYSHAMSILKKMFNEIEGLHISGWFDRKKMFLEDINQYIMKVDRIISHQLGRLTNIHIDANGTAKKISGAKLETKVTPNDIENYDSKKGELENILLQNESKMRDFREQEGNIEQRFLETQQRLSVINKKTADWQEWIRIAAAKADDEIESEVYQGVKRYFALEGEKLNL